jgi:hypothetical protein
MRCAAVIQAPALALRRCIRLYVVQYYNTVLRSIRSTVFLSPSGNDKPCTPVILRLALSGAPAGYTTLCPSGPYPGLLAGCMPHASSAIPADACAERV